MANTPIIIAMTPSIVGKAITATATTAQISYTLT